MEDLEAVLPPPSPDPCNNDDNNNNDSNNDSNDDDGEDVVVEETNADVENGTMTMEVSSPASTTTITRPPMFVDVIVSPDVDTSGDVVECPYAAVYAVPLEDCTHPCKSSSPSNRDDNLDDTTTTTAVTTCHTVATTKPATVLQVLDMDDEETAVTSPYYYESTDSLPTVTSLPLPSSQQPPQQPPRSSQHHCSYAMSCLLLVLPLATMAAVGLVAYSTLTNRTGTTTSSSSSSSSSFDGDDMNHP